MSGPLPQVVEIDAQPHESACIRRETTTSQQPHVADQKNPPYTEGIMSQSGEKSTEPNSGDDHMETDPDSPPRTFSFSLKKKRQRPVSKLSAEERVKQYPEEFYSDGGVLFCKFCKHSVDIVRLNTIKDHLASKKHILNKEAKAPAKQLRQQTLASCVSSHDLREDFILDFVKMCTVSDIPLEKTEKMKPFLVKYCRQGGCLPHSSALRKTYVARLYEGHYKALKAMFEGVKSICIIADETTDIRDHSVLNIVAGVMGKYVLIEVVTMSACNHATFSQAIIKAVSDVGIAYDSVTAIVTDSAAYCKKAFKDVLSAIFPNAVQVLCMAHIINLAGEVFKHWAHFQKVDTLVTMVKSAFFKKPGRKVRFLNFLREYLPADQVKLPPVPVSTRWNSWFEAVQYHATHLHLYEGFFKSTSNSFQPPLNGSCKSGNSHQNCHCTIPNTRPGPVLSSCSVESPETILLSSKHGEDQKQNPKYFKQEPPKKKKLSSTLFGSFSRKKAGNEPGAIEMQCPRTRNGKTVPSIPACVVKTTSLPQPAIQVEAMNKNKPLNEVKEGLQSEAILQNAESPSEKHSGCKVALPKSMQEGTPTRSGSPKSKVIHSRCVAENLYDDDSDEQPRAKLDKLVVCQGSSSKESGLGPVKLPDGVTIHEDEYPPEFLEIQYDCVLIYAENDRDSALRFKDLVEKYVKLKTGKPRVCLFDHWGTLTYLQSKFDRLEEALKRSTYVMLYITDDFCNTPWGQMQRDEALIETLESPVRRSCLIPVYTQQYYNNDPKQKYPPRRFGFASLKGLDMSRILRNSKLEEISVSEFAKLMQERDHFFLRTLRKILSDRLHLKQKREEENLKKLREWLIKEGDKRYQEKLLKDSEEKLHNQWREKENDNLHMDLKQREIEAQEQIQNSRLQGGGQRFAYGRGPFYDIGPHSTGQGTPLHPGHQYNFHNGQYSQHPPPHGFYPRMLPSQYMANFSHFPPGHMGPPMCGFQGYYPMMQPPSQHTTYNIASVGVFSQGNQNEVVVKSNADDAEELYSVTPDPQDNMQPHFHSKTLKDGSIIASDEEVCDTPSAIRKTDDSQSDGINSLEAAASRTSPVSRSSETMANTSAQHQWEKERVRQLPTENACPQYGAEREVRVTADLGELELEDTISSRKSSANIFQAIDSSATRTDGPETPLPHSPMIAFVKPLLQPNRTDMERKSSDHELEEETLLKTPAQASHHGLPEESLLENNETSLKLPASQTQTFTSSLSTFAVESGQHFVQSKQTLHADATAPSSSPVHLLDSNRCYFSDRVRPEGCSTSLHANSRQNAGQQQVDSTFAASALHNTHTCSTVDSTASGEGQIASGSTGTRLSLPINSSAHVAGTCVETDVSENTKECHCPSSLETGECSEQKSSKPRLISPTDKASGDASTYTATVRESSLAHHQEQPPRRISGNGHNSSPGIRQGIPVSYADSGPAGLHPSLDNQTTPVMYPTSFPYMNMYHNNPYFQQPMSTLSPQTPMHAGDSMHGGGPGSGTSDPRLSRSSAMNHNPSGDQYFHLYSNQMDGQPIMNPYMWPGYFNYGPNYGPIPGGAMLPGFHNGMQHMNDSNTERRRTTEVD